MTALPTGARLEAELAEGVVLWDVSALMPRGRHQRQTRRPASTRLACALVHHSGSLGLPGVEGAHRSALFTTQHRDFPGPGYHFWLPRDPVRDELGRLVCLRLVPDVTRAWHSGGRANDRGLGIALQGNTSKLPVSPSQQELLEALLPWLAERHGWDWTAIRSWLGWHSDAARLGGRPKAACPGLDAERWLRGYLARATAAAA